MPLAEQLAKAEAKKSKKDGGDKEAQEAFAALAAAMGIPEPKRGAARAALNRYIDALEDNS
jgi:hypothetical protein